jgi:hypothetical protein
MDIPDFTDIGSQSVWCGRTRLGVLKRGGQLTPTLPPGTYWLGTNKKQRLIALDLEEGNAAYVRAFTAAGSSRSGPTYCTVKRTGSD